MDDLWLTHGKLLALRGAVYGALQIARGRIAAIRPRAPRGAKALDVRGLYVAPGFIDVHVWGDPQRVAREAVRYGTTAFLTTLGPQSPAALRQAVVEAAQPTDTVGAQCLGLHLE